MRLLFAVVLVGILAVTACGGGSPTLASPTSPSTPTTTNGGTSGTTVAGTWAGSASDSTGTMMGGGVSTSMMANMTWQITQTGTLSRASCSFPATPAAA